jgi:hypothetical protein
VRFALVAVLLLACGSPNSGDSDGGDDDGGGDGDAGVDVMIDADPSVRGTVSVKLVDKSAAPLAGMYVVFIDTDATVTERMTDAAGMAQADVYPNATVTAIRNRGMSYSVVTVTALNPGDAITLVTAPSTVTSSEDPFSNRVVPMPGADIAASPNGASKSGTTGTFTTVGPHGLAAGDGVLVSNVANPAYNGGWTVASVPNATTFTVTMPSGNLANSGTTAVGATAMKAVRFTVNYNASPSPGAYFVHTTCGTTNVGTSLTPTLTLPVGCVTSSMDIVVLAKTSTTYTWTQQAAVAVTHGGATTITDTWKTRTPIVATYTNPSPAGIDASLARFSPYLRGIAETEATAMLNGTTMIMLDASTANRSVLSTQLTCPSTVSGCLSNPQGSSAQRITHVVDGTATTYSLDVGANLLPWLKANYVPATTTLEIMTMGSVPFDIFEANLRYTRGQTIFTWRVFGPLAQNVTFPTLPATAPGNPSVLPTDIMSSYQAFIGESDAISGYRDAIKNPFEALGACEASSNNAVKPAPGTKSRISQWN